LPAVNKINDKGKMGEVHFEKEKLLDSVGRTGKCIVGFYGRMRQQ